MWKSITMVGDGYVRLVMFIDEIVADIHALWAIYHPPNFIASHSNKALFGTLMKLDKKYLNLILCNMVTRKYWIDNTII